MALVPGEHIVEVEGPPPPESQPQRPKWSRCIYKVPEPLRKLNPVAYTPLLISIGPIHHRNRNLKSMKDRKKSYSESFWKHRARNERSYDEYSNYLDTEEQNIRKCYSEKFTHFSKEKFVKIILLDSVFIMELFLRNKNNSQQNEEEEKDFILSNEWGKNFIRRDLLLLENQLPINVLEELYKIALKQSQSFLDITKAYFENDHPQRPRPESQPCFKEVKHFTDLVRYFYIPCQKYRFESYSQVLKTATKLKTTGITFEPPDPVKPLLEIDFKKGRLSKLLLCFSCIPWCNTVKARLLLPTFQINGETEQILRNLIAYEQCHCPQDAFVCCYVSFFDDLIHSREDVDLLVESGVLAHELGSDKEVAVLINGLCKNVVITKTCYDQKIGKLNDHYSSKWNFSMAQLRNVYCQDLWRASSTIVGLAVIAFTFVNFFRHVI